MVITALSVLASVVVNSINSKGEHDFPLPPSLRTFIISLARCLCYTLLYVTPPDHSETTHQQKTNPNSSHKTSKFVSPQQTDQDNNHLHLPTEQFSKLRQLAGESSADLDTNDVDLLISSLRRLLVGKQKPTKGQQLTGFGSYDNLWERVTPTGSFQNLNYPRDHPGQSSSKEVKEDTGREEAPLDKQWEEAATVIDRLLFIFFLFSTVGVTVYTLIILPLYNPLAHRDN